MRVPALKPMQYLTLAGVLALTTAGGYFAYERFAPRRRGRAGDGGRGGAGDDRLQRHRDGERGQSGAVQADLQVRRAADRAAGAAWATRCRRGSPWPAWTTPTCRSPSHRPRPATTAPWPSWSRRQRGQPPGGHRRRRRPRWSSAQISLAQKRAVAGGPDVAAAQSQVEQRPDQAADSCRPAGGGGHRRRGRPSWTRRRPSCRRPAEPRARRTWPARESQVEQARIKLEQLQNPRAGGHPQRRGASSPRPGPSCRPCCSPRPEDLAAAQAPAGPARPSWPSCRTSPRRPRPRTWPTPSWR